MGAERMDRADRRRFSPAYNVLCFNAKESDMKKRKIKVLEAVALTEDMPSRKLRAGEVGTVVELLGPDVYEVEFCDDNGETYAEFALRAGQIIALHTRGKALATALVKS